MPTLWDIITGNVKKKKSLEQLFTNPLDLRIGNSIRVDNVDLSDVAFSLIDFREVKRIIDGVSCFFVDYGIYAKPYGKDEINRRIRLSPKGDDYTTKIEDYDVVLYNKISECQYDEAFHKSLEGQEEFVEQDATYWRVNDNTKQQDAVIITVDAKSVENYKTDENWLPRKHTLTYWDFWRECEDEGGTKTLEFYNIEMNENGFFEFWVGRKVDPTRISIV